METKEKNYSDIYLHSGNCFSKLFFSHLAKMIQVGSKEPYRYDMLFKMEDRMMYAHDYPKFEEFVEQNKEKYKDDFLGLVYKFHWPLHMRGMIFNFFRYFSTFLFPYLLKRFITYVKDEGDLKDGLLWGGLLILNLVTQVMVSLWGYFNLENATLVVKNTMRVDLICYYRATLLTKSPQYLREQKSTLMWLQFRIS